MAEQIPFDMLEDDAMSWPEKEISNNTFPSLHRPYTIWPLQVCDEYSICVVRAASEIFNKYLLHELVRPFEIMHLPSDAGWGRRLGLDEPENPGSKIEMQFSFDRDDMSKLSSNRNAGDHHWKLSCLWKEPCGKEPLSQEPQEEFNMMGVKNWIDKLRRFVFEAEDLLDEIETSGFMSLKAKKIEMQFSFDREDMSRLSCNRYLGDHLWKLSSPWKKLCGEELLSQKPQVTSRRKSLNIRGSGCQIQIGLLRYLGICPRNHFTPLGGSELLTSMNKVKQVNNTGNKFCLDNNESCVVLDIDLMETFDWGGKMTPEQHWFERNVPRDPVCQHGDTFNQHNRKKTAQRVSSFVVSTIVFLGIFLDLWGQLSIILVQPLHKEHHPVSMWPHLLGLFGFMVFVWAVGIMILLGAPFTRMQGAMLVFWAVLMLLKSANAISAVFVPILGIFFMGCFARGNV